MQFLNEIKENLTLLHLVIHLEKKQYPTLLGALTNLPPHNINLSTLKYLQSHKRYPDSILFNNNARKSDFNDYNSHRFQLILLLLSTHALGQKFNLNQSRDQVDEQCNHLDLDILKRSDLHSQRMDSFEALERVTQNDTASYEIILEKFAHKYNSIPEFERQVRVKKEQFEVLNGACAQYKEFIKFLTQLEKIEFVDTLVLDGKDFTSLSIQADFDGGHHSRQAIHIETLELYTRNQDSELLFDFNQLLRLFILSNS